MSFDVVLGLVGVGAGAAASLVGVYLNGRIQEKREERKEQVVHEEEAISQVYSPLVFILNKAREIFVSIFAIKNALAENPEVEEHGGPALFFVQYLLARKAAIHPKVLEELLMKKAGLMEPSYYSDLFFFQSYLETIVHLLDTLIMSSLEEPKKLQSYLNSFGPIIKELDTAIERMRLYAGQRTTRQHAKYTQFFDEKKIAEIETYINDANKELTGTNVPDWEETIKKMQI